MKATPKKESPKKEVPIKEVKETPKKAAKVEKSTPEIKVKVKATIQ